MYRALATGSALLLVFAIVLVLVSFNGSGALYSFVDLLPVKIILMAVVFLSLSLVFFNVCVVMWAPDVKVRVNCTIVSIVYIASGAIFAANWRFPSIEVDGGEFIARITWPAGMTYFDPTAIVVASLICLLWATVLYCAVDYFDGKRKVDQPKA